MQYTYNGLISQLNQANAAGKTDTEIAHILGYTKHHLSRVRNGHRNVTERFLKLFCSAFGCVVEDLREEINNG